METIYRTTEWRTVAARAKARDGHRCTVARLLGGSCSKRLHAHHLVPVSEGGAAFDLENVITACASHHPRLEALRRAIHEGRATRLRRCPHRHRYEFAREMCERRLNARAA